MASRSARPGADQVVEGPLGAVPPGKASTVAADDGTPLAVEEIEPAGGERARLTVVGVHGFALAKQSWHFQRVAFASSRVPPVRQVYYDHRGHGASAASGPGDSTIEQLAADLAAVLRAMAPSEPVVLMGHSMGGMVIMELAQQHPELFAEQIRGVALLATAAGEVGGRGLRRSLLWRYNPLTRGVGELAGWQPGLVEFVRAAGGQLTRHAVRRLAFGRRDVDSRLVDFMLEMLDMTPVRQLVQFVDTLGSHNRYAALAGLKHVPVLVIGADADRLTPYEHAERIAAELPDATLVRVRGAGHMVQLEQPELVNGQLVELLQKCCGGMESGKWARRLRWWRK